MTTVSYGKERLKRKGVSENWEKNLQMPNVSPTYSSTECLDLEEKSGRRGV